MNLNLLHEQQGPTHFGTPCIMDIMFITMQIWCWRDIKYSLLKTL